MIIAVVSQDRVFHELTHEFLSDEGYQTIDCFEGAQALDLICREQPDLVLMDLWIEHPCAGEMVLAMLRLHPATRRTPVILCTTDPYYEDKTPCRADPHCEIVMQPVGLEELLDRIKHIAAGLAARDHANAAAENRGEGIRH